MILGLLPTVAACGDEGASSHSSTPARTSTPTPAAEGETGADGFPQGFAYPKGATVKTTAPQHSLYTIAGTDAETVKDYWGPHMSSLGFEPAAETDSSGTYQRGTTMIQITWNQAGNEVRGAANVLTP